MSLVNIIILMYMETDIKAENNYVRSRIKYYAS